MCQDTGANPWRATANFRRAVCHPSGMRLSQACVLSAAPHPMQGRIPLRPGQFQRCPAETCSKHQAACRHSSRKLQ